MGYPPDYDRTLGSIYASFFAVAANMDLFVPYSDVLYAVGISF